MDFLDLLVPTDTEYSTGYYYPKMPNTAEDTYSVFRYETINPYSRRFDTVLNNLRADSESCAIKTNDDCDFAIGSFISTQDGELWIIRQIIRGTQIKGKEEQLRFLKRSTATESTLFLEKIENPLGVGE